MSTDKPDSTQKEFGEGNYKATRQYNEATKKFIESGRVEEAAANARPANEAEARAMNEAERAGKSRAKEEDPAVRRPEENQNRDQKEERAHHEERLDHEERAQTQERAQNRQQEGTGAAAGTTHNPVNPRSR